MQHKVFVYGTLKSGYGNNSLLHGAVRIGEGFTIFNQYTMYCNGGFPYVFEAGEAHVMGEVYLVDGDTFARLDTLEGYPRHYNRVIIPVDVEGHLFECWMYVGQDEKSTSQYCRKVEPDEHNTLLWSR